jgi:hypothetical protein
MAQKAIAEEIVASAIYKVMLIRLIWVCYSNRVVFGISDVLSLSAR